MKINVEFKQEEDCKKCSLHFACDRPMDGETIVEVLRSIVAQADTYEATLEEKLAEDDSGTSH